MDGELVQTALGNFKAAWRETPAATPCRVNVLIRPEQIDLRPAAPRSHANGEGPWAGDREGPRSADRKGASAGDREGPPAGGRKGAWNGGAGSNSESSPAGRIVKTGYHGHDSLLHVAVALEHGEQPLVVRTLGDTRLPSGTEVTLSVRDTVLVWPA
jgi:hypothetical protein